MKSRAFGQTGVSLPIIGQGTWEMQHDTQPEVALRHGIDLGMTHIDTAELYGSGAVERIVGKAIAGRRHDLYLVSKVIPSNASAKGTLAACERSLRALATDYLDLYLLHWPGSHPLEETFEAFERLQARGHIRAYGVSNFDVDDLREATALVGASRIACNQVYYQPGERAIEQHVLPACEAMGIPVVAYSPLGNGRMPPPSTQAGRALATIAASRDVSVQQVALRFVVRHAHVFAIPKASTVAHVSDNAAAGDWALSDDEIMALEAACPPPSKTPGIPML
jgi:diketogulonate reductase-like aldo/keto reductase